MVYLMYNPAILFCHSHRFCPTVPLAGSKEHMTIRKKLCVYFNPLKEDFSIAAVAVGAICTRHQQRECQGVRGSSVGGGDGKAESKQQCFPRSLQGAQTRKVTSKSKQHSDIPTEPRRYEARKDTHRTQMQSAHRYSRTRASSAR